MIAVVISALFTCGLAEALSNEVSIADRGQPKAAIFMADGASERTREAAQTLAEYLGKATGAQFALTQASGSDVAHGLTKILVGLDLCPSNVAIRLEGMDGDGFLISFPDPETVVIAGVTDWGTEFGVYEFLERYAGVRWLLPGPDGEHVPLKDTLQIEDTREVRMQPAFFSRCLSGLPNKTQALWARRNRMHCRIDFHHALFKIFPPSKYAKSRPDFYPLINGKRVIPSSDNDQDWQPCFSAEGIVGEAVKNICSYFEKHPEATSFSLGVNDSGRYCECPQCLKRRGVGTNAQGYPDFSDYYFTWANAVATGVLKTFPNKWFGCLAYREIAQPPTNIRISPRIIPYITYDRMQWVDPALAQADRELTERWKAATASMGWYDYIYGSPYLIPRVYFDTMAAYYRFAALSGVRALYAEAYPNWGEGPKLYLTLKLQWDPSLDVKKVLEDWYTCAVGKNSAPYLAEYYQIWEEFWTEAAKDTPWFKNGRIYLPFSRPDYLVAVHQEQIAKSRSLLTKVLDLAGTTHQKARAQMILNAFEYYESSALAYLGIVEGLLPADQAKAMDRKRFDLIRRFAEDPVLVHPVRADKTGYFRFK